VLLLLVVVVEAAAVVFAMHNLDVLRNFLKTEMKGAVRDAYSGRHQDLWTNRINEIQYLVRMLLHLIASIRK
jgi:hypothetical protein